MMIIIIIVILLIMIITTIIIFRVFIALNISTMSLTELPRSSDSGFLPGTY